MHNDKIRDMDRISVRDGIYIVTVKEGVRVGNGNWDQDLRLRVRVMMRVRGYGSGLV